MHLLIKNYDFGTPLILVDNSYNLYDWYNIVPLTHSQLYYKMNILLIKKISGRPNDIVQLSGKKRESLSNY